METEITSDWIDRYNENELDENERAIFCDRMRVNPLLRSEVNIDASLTRFLQDDELMDLMKKVGSASRRKEHSNRLMNPLLIAASVLALLMIGGMWYLVRTKAITSMTVANHAIQIGPKQDGRSYSRNFVNEFQHAGLPIPMPLHQPVRHDLLAASYTPLAEFELLIGSVTRSNQFKLTSPQVEVSIPAGTEVLFTWRYYDEIVPVFIVILNNAGMPVCEIPLENASSYRLKTNSFRQGLYYWKIISDDDLVVMGKFTLL